MLQMRCSHSYTLNKNVFSLRLNMSSPTSDVQQEDCSTNAVPGRRNISLGANLSALQTSDYQVKRHALAVAFATPIRVDTRIIPNHGLVWSNCWERVCCPRITKDSMQCTWWPKKVSHYQMIKKSY